MSGGVVADVLSLAGRRTGRRMWWAVLIGVALLGDWGFGVIARSFDAPTAWTLRLILVWLLGSTLVYASWLRFQDRDRPGWLALALPLAAALDGFATRLSGPEQSSLLGGVLIMGVLAWLVIELGLMGGSDGHNRYGPAPGTRDGAFEGAAPSS